MEEGSAKSEENAQYSFLLGSALRYEDTEQFLQVYDAVVPKDLPPKQVDTIKELARKIAELPKEEFNALYTELQQSDAAAAFTSIGMSTVSTKQQHPICCVTQDEGPSATHSPKHCPGSVSCVVKKGVSPGRHKAETPEEVEEQDSGVFNLSKTTTSSMSDDTEMADEYESRGVYDYLPRHKSSLARTMDNIEQRLKNDNAYDDAENALESDGENGEGNELLEVVVDKHPDQTIEGGIEMKTFRMESKACASDRDNERMLHKNLYLQQHNEELQQLNTLTYDEAVPVADDDDNNEVIPHQHLHGRKVGRFSSMQREDSEDYDAESPEGLRLSPSRRLGPMSTSKPKASDGVRIEQEVRQRGHMQMPPFGDPVNMDKMNKAAERLIDFNSSSLQEVKNLPPAERIHNNVGADKDSEGNNTETTGKKKKKKKKTQKDEGDDGSNTQKDSSVDINGNPMMERSTASSLRTSSMRSNNYSNFPRTTEPFSRMEINGQPISDMDDLPGSRSEKEQKKSRATRRRDREAAQMKKAEDVEGFKGDKRIDELLDFIESGSGKKKKKVNSPGVVNGNAEVGGTVPNGHVGNDIAALTKNGKKVKHTNNKSKLLSSQKDSEKSSEDTSEKADDSSSGKSESDDVKEPEVVVAGENKKKAETKIPPEEQFKPVSKMAPEEHAKTVSKLVPEEQAKSISVSSNLGNFSATIKDFDENDVFIFTDFENVQPLAEGEFNVVTRKKRQRVIPQPMFMGSNHKDQPRENYYYDTMYGNYSGYNSVLGAREDRGSFRDDQRPVQRRSRPIVRSVTPPPTSTSVEKEHYYYQEKVSGERAFSPSAFPALGGMREGRRNSTGDVPSAMTPDDSDMESVKSLPLVAGSAAVARAEETLSPIISYAKIAAGPKAANKSGAVATWASKAEPEAAASAPDTGRRHSLPSLTDPMLDHAASEAACTSQTATESVQDGDSACDAKPEAQNNTPKDPMVNVCPKTDQNIASLVHTVPEAARSNEIIVKGTRRQSSRSESDISEKKDAVIANSRKVAKLETVILPGLLQPETKSSGLTFGSNCSSSDVQVGPALPILDQKEFPAITGSVAAVTFPKAIACQPSKTTVVPVPAAPTSQSQQDASTALSAPPKATPPPSQNNTKKLKNKSVVFLDRRARSSTPNLGISFGFDTRLEVVVPKPAPTDGPVVKAAVTMSTVPPASASSQSAPAVVDVSEAKPAVVSGFNGLVLPPGLSTVAAPVDVKVAPPTQVAPPAEGDPAAVIESTPGAPSGGSTAAVPALPAEIDNNKRVIDLHNLVPLNRSMDPNFVRGRFAVEETAYYLKEQWDHVMDRKNKNPATVTFYDPSQ